ncbi:MAG: hypothetical protein NT067_06940 [Candidatus Diapherotrites archaeon]|nr:hypothetical protein [Candidatus Diapherotrites archaeon]
MQRVRRLNGRTHFLSDYKPEKPGTHAKFVSPEVRKIQEREMEVLTLVEDAKRKIVRKGARKTGKIDLSATLDAISPALIKFFEMGYGQITIASRILRPVFPETIPSRTVQKGISRWKARREEEGMQIGRGKYFAWPTMKERRKEAKRLNSLFDRISRLKAEHPTRGTEQIGKKLGLDPLRAKGLLDFFADSVSTPEKKEVFSTKPPKRKKRINSFSKEEKFFKVYEQHVGLIKKIVLGYARRLRLSRDDTNDFIADVRAGLIGELDLFDPERKIKESTFIGNRADGLCKHWIMRRIARGRIDSAQAGDEIRAIKRALRESGG